MSTPMTAPGPWTGCPGSGGSSMAATSGTPTTGARRSSTTVVDRPARVDVERTETGPVRGTIVIDSELQLPERGGLDHDGRSMRTGPPCNGCAPRSNCMPARPSSASTVELDHHVRDHRLRVHLPLLTPDGPLARRVRVRPGAAAAVRRGRAQRVGRADVSRRAGSSAPAACSWPTRGSASTSWWISTARRPGGHHRSDARAHAGARHRVAVAWPDGVTTAARRPRGPPGGRPVPGAAPAALRRGARCRGTDRPP